MFQIPRRASHGDRFASRPDGTSATGRRPWGRSRSAARDTGPRLGRLRASRVVGVESPHGPWVRSCPGKERVMASDARLSIPVDTSSSTRPDAARLYQEGIIAGIVGALTIALWFLLLDTLSGRPLWTPTVVAAPVLRVLSSWSILVANLLAAATMTAYFWYRHPDLRVSP